MTERTTAKQQLESYKNELNEELRRILKFWTETACDTAEGGFYGKIDNNNKITAGAPKGSVLNARILWAFSAAYNLNQEAANLELANRAYQYLISHFIDNQYGGVYWMVNYRGEPNDTKKQVYATAFTIYGLSEFYMASGNEDAKQRAIDLFYLLVEKAYDPVETGYFEAFSREWGELDNLRLSAKDANEKKTMNTHLHVVEAFANLYRVWPDKALKSHIETLLNNFLDHFIDKKTHHLVLFFDEEWNRKSNLISYGHDIEAAWLLQEAAEVTGDELMIREVKDAGMLIAKAAIEGLDTDGGIWYEYEPEEDHLVKEKHWWGQAEAMVGFYNAWQVSGDEKYLGLSINSWLFTKNNLLDKINGEWFWGVDENGQVLPLEDKAGIWKCPYHNSRAGIEIIKRVREGEGWGR